MDFISGQAIYIIIFAQLFKQNFFQVLQTPNAFARAPIALIGDRTDMLCCLIIVIIGVFYIFHCVFPAFLCICLEIRAVCVISFSSFVYQNKLMCLPCTWILFCMIGIVDAIAAFQPIFALPLVRKVTGAAPPGFIRSTIQIISVKLSVAGF